MYFKLTTGRIVRERDLELAYEVCHGKKPNDSPEFRRWKGKLLISRIPESEITVEQLIKGDAFVEAVRLYKDRHNCTLREAREACDRIRNAYGN